MSKIFIGFPCYNRQIDVEILLDFAQLINRYNGEHYFALDFISGSIIANARNYLVKRFLETDFEWLYFWDADIVIRTPEFMNYLLETAEKFDAKIVGGAYRTKDPLKRYALGNIDPNLGRIVNKHVGDLTTPQLIDGIATGSMLIHRSVFSQIPDPWFEFKEKAGGGVLPEDYNFCLKAKEAGIKVAVDPRFPTFHFGPAYWEHSPVTT